MNTLLSRALWGALVAGGITLGGGTAAMAADHDAGLGLDAVAEAVVDIGLDGAAADPEALAATAAADATADAVIEVALVESTAVADATADAVVGLAPDIGDGSSAVVDAVAEVTADVTADTVADATADAAITTADAPVVDGSAEGALDALVVGSESGGDQPLVDAVAEAQGGATAGEGDALLAAGADACLSFGVLGSASGCTAPTAGSGADSGAASDADGELSTLSLGEDRSAPSGGLSVTGAAADGSPMVTGAAADGSPAVTGAAVDGRLAITGVAPVAPMGALLGGLALALGLGGLATARRATRGA